MSTDELVVVEPFGCHEQDLGPYDIRIRQRIPMVWASRILRSWLLNEI
jgi:hypothetical protein